MIDGEEGLVESEMISIPELPYSTIAALRNGSPMVLPSFQALTFHNDALRSRDSMSSLLLSLNCAEGASPEPEMLEGLEC
jgi:hypothetical protein